MKDLEFLDNKRAIGLNKIPVEEYGFKWIGGTIMLRRYLNDNNVEIFGNIGGYFDSMEINYFDMDGTDFVYQYKQVIKEMIQGLENNFITN